MSDQFTVTLSDAAANWVNWFAKITGRSASRVVRDTIEETIFQFNGESRSLSDWSDQDVLDAADSKMPLQMQARLKELQQQLDEGTIDPSGRSEHDAIIKICQVERLRKARGMAEAIRRGLRGPAS